MLLLKMSPGSPDGPARIIQIFSGYHSDWCQDVLISFWFFLCTFAHFWQHHHHQCGWPYGSPKLYSIWTQISKLRLIGMIITFNIWMIIITIIGHHDIDRHHPHGWSKAIVFDLRSLNPRNRARSIGNVVILFPGTISKYASHQSISFLLSG